MSYLSVVKSQLEDVFFDAFDRAWKEVVEPALKQSYKNGLADGRAGKDSENGEATVKPRRQWARKPKHTEDSGDERY